MEGRQCRAAPEACALSPTSPALWSVVATVPLGRGIWADLSPGGEGGKGTLLMPRQGSHELLIQALFTSYAGIQQACLASTGF